MSVFSLEACTHDSECQLNCEHLGLCDLTTGKCSCLLLFEPLPSAAKCVDDADCANFCGPTCKYYNCDISFCICHCSA
ncbi:hypothetical protein ES332_D07G087400v1 [Gossypium tomentosum]|uniref:Uncharacterized protein n=1 Tax=Gossypium tomentosum TaxID=34277 RepID=A0A5D2K4C3_GOSTO|nr:hypothetical protein ES332_D07G087400v1 [Gossypium tomentosum]